MNEFCLTLVNKQDKLFWKKTKLDEDNKLRCLQKEVEGKIESITYLFPKLSMKNILVYINQDSKLSNYPTTLIYCDRKNNFEEIKGNICFVKVTKKGDLTGLKDKDIELIYNSIRGI